MTKMPRDFKSAGSDPKDGDTAPPIHQLFPGAAANLDGSPNVRLVTDREDLLVKLRDMAVDPTQIYQLEVLAKAAHKTSGKVKGEVANVLQKLQGFIDADKVLYPEVKAVLEELYPTQQQLFEATLKEFELPNGRTLLTSNLARMYNTRVGRPPVADDIPDQELRKRFVANIDAELTSVEPSLDASQREKPVMESGVA